MAQVDFVNYFSIVIWFNLLFLFFYLINYTYIVPIIYNNMYIRSRRFQYFVNYNKIQYSKIFLLISKNINNNFNSYNFYKLNLNVFTLYSNFVVYKLITC